MKKQPSINKPRLRLDKEAIRILTLETLAPVVGGSEGGNSFSFSICPFCPMSL